MPGATTPDGIGFPLTSDPQGDLASWFAQQAADVQAALTAIRAEAIKPPVPAPISIRGGDQQAVTAAAWADLPNAPAITLVLSQACWVTITHAAWIYAVAGTDVRASATVSGATVLSETQLEVGGDNSAWGQVLYSDGSTTRQGSGTRTVRLNAGTNTIKLRAYRTGAGSAGVNYSTLQVAPLRWA